MLVSPISKTDKMVKRFVTKMNLQMFFVTEILVTGFWRVPTDIQTVIGFILLLSNEPGRSSELIFGLWEYKDDQCSDIAS